MEPKPRRRRQSSGGEGSARVEIKATVTPGQKARVDRAAALRDMSTMNYVRSAVLSAVEADLGTQLKPVTSGDRDDLRVVLQRLADVLVSALGKS
jgi:hypothetical protein